MRLKSTQGRWLLLASVLGSSLAFLEGSRVLPSFAGIGGANFADPAVFSPGFAMGTLICAGLLGAAGVISGVLIRNKALLHKEVSPEAVD